MVLLDKLGIVHKLLLIVLVPILAMLYFSVDSVLEKARDVDEMRMLEQLTGLSIKVGNLVHELQRERGMSAGFIGSKGANFADALPGQRERTDARQGELNATLKDFDVAGFGAGLE